MFGNPDEESTGRRGAQMCPALLIGQYNEDWEMIIESGNMKVIWDSDNSRFGEVVEVKAWLE